MTNVIIAQQSWNIGATAGDRVTATLRGDTLTISGTGRMKDYGTISAHGAAPTHGPAPWSGISINKVINKVIIEDKVTTIGSGAFGNLIELKSVTIGKDVTSIGLFAFWNCNLTSITILNSIPPNANEGGEFASVNETTCILYVPKGSENAYRTAAGWKEFKNIRGIDVPNTQAKATDKKIITVGFSQCKIDESDWRMANTRSVQEALSAANGFRLITADSNNNAAKQIADVQGFIDQSVDYIIIAAVNMDGWDTVLRNAQRARIPVILMDRTINADSSLYTTLVGIDFKGGGKKAIEWMKRHFGNKQVNIVHLQGQLRSNAQVGRSAALTEAVASNARWNILAQQTANWSTGEAKQIMASWIRQYGNRINCVYAENDNMADGAIQALKEARIRVGGANGVTIISFDANRWALDMTLAGEINCNVECNPLHGPTVKDVIMRLEKGQTVPKITYVEDEMYLWNTMTQKIIDARRY